MTLEVVGIQEIADLLGVSKQRVSQIIQTRPDFPPPDAELTIGRIWLRPKIDAWVKTYDRRPGRPSRSRVEPTGARSTAGSDARRKRRSTQP